MSAFLIERFPPDTDTDRDRDEGEPDDYDNTPDHRRHAQRPKIRRCRLTVHQLQTLNQVFDQDSQPSMETRIALGVQLGMETKQVSAWFQNKRQKLKNTQTATFPSSSLPPSSHPQDLDSRQHHHSDYPSQQPYHSRDLPTHEYHPYHQSYSNYPRHHPQPFTTIEHEPSYLDRYPHPYRDRYMKPITTTFQLPPASHLLAIPAGPMDGMNHRVSIRSRSVSTRSSSAGTDYTGTAESVHQPDSYSDYLTKTASFMPPTSDKGTTKGVATPAKTKAKREPMDDDHHSLSLGVPSPPPEAVQSPVPKPKSVGNRRTSARARSARLAVSPIIANRALSSTTSVASNQGEGQQKRLTRSRMSAAQRSYLHGIYERNPEPSMAERQVIADKLGVQVGKITNWFRNLRQSVRRGKLLDVKLANKRGETVDSSKADELEEDDEMDVDEEKSHHSDMELHASPSPAPRGFIPGTGAYSTRSLIAASEVALQSPASFYEAEEDDEEEEEEAHEAVTPHHSPESKLAHSFGPSAPTVSTSTPDNDNMLSPPSPRGGISLPSINITLAESQEKRSAQKFRSAVEDALLLLHFRQNCDVRDIHHGVVVGRRASPTLF